MPRQSIMDLKLTADRRYWPSLAAPGPNGTRFESKAEAKAEDNSRVLSLLKASKLHRDALNVKAARKLAKRLNYEARGKSPPRSGASSLHMRTRRNAEFGHLWQLAEHDPSVAVFTVIKRGLEFTFDELMQVSPRKLLKAFISDLNRVGAAKADGWLIVWLHGEFEIPTGIYRLHLHGLSSGGMTNVVSRLRQRANYRSTREKPRTDPVFQRIRIYRSLKQLPYPLTYCCKSYWPLKVVVDTADGPKRTHGHKRILEPHHSQVLLFLDKWQPSDFAVLVHLQVKAGKLVPSRSGRRDAQ